MVALRLRYRVLLFVACSFLLIGFVKNSTLSRAEAEEVETKEVSMDVYDETVKTIDLSVYDGDYSTYKSKLAKIIKVEANLSLQNKVEKLMTSLSDTLYNGLPIEVSIEDRSNKKVAIINLIEPLSKDNKKFKEIYEGLDDKSGTWQNYFTSGEAKSIVTLASIETTLKQPNYSGAWIDGFMIYHNGEALESHRGITATDVTWIYK
ncbi:MAG: hypothetical protein MJ245_00625 [Clostridia bacterium]|nr:hypothetical protein [Clostridia bacterium]